MSDTSEQKASMGSCLRRLALVLAACASSVPFGAIGARASCPREPSSDGGVQVPLVVGAGRFDQPRGATSFLVAYENESNYLFVDGDVDPASFGLAVGARASGVLYAGFATGKYAGGEPFSICLGGGGD